MTDTDSDRETDAGATRRRVHRRDGTDRERASERGRAPDVGRRWSRNRGRGQRPLHESGREGQPDTVGAAPDPAARLQRTAGNRAVQAAVRSRRERQGDESDAGGRSMEPTGDTVRSETRTESATPSFPSGGGTELPEESRRFFERRFDRSLTAVSVHTGPGAAAVARALDADAVTHGKDVYFGAGRFRPHSAAGRGLLAHELAHTIQQPESATAAIGADADVTDQGDPLERQARAATRRIAAGHAVDAAALGTATQPVVARRATDQSSVPVGPTRPARSGGGDGSTDGAGPDGPGGATADENRIELQGSATVDAAAISERLPEGKRRGSVPVKFGSLAAGSIEVRQRADGTYSTKGRQSIGFMHPALDPVSQRDGVAPVLRVSLDNNTLGGFVSLSGAKFSENSPRALVNWVAANPALMGWTGLDKVSFPSVENTIEGGQLTLLASGFTFRLGGFMDGSGEFGLTGETVVFSADATVAVDGLTEADLSLERTESGALTGSVRVPVAYDQFEGEVLAEFGNGTVSMEGTATYTGEKFSGTATLLVTDAETATQLARQRLGEDAVKSSAEEAEGEEADPGTEPAKGPKPGPRALAGYGTLEVHLTDWLAGTADVIVDGNGEVTVVGEVAPPAEITLFEQEDYVHEFPRIEVKAIYGVPVVGNLNVFANIGVDAIAKLGPGKLYDITLEGTYSTDPDVYQNYSLAATLNVSAFAGVRVRAEGGAGVTIVAHDLKAGVGIEGTAGIRGYVEARPTIGYREVADPSKGKTGQFFIAGHMEIAAQPTIGLAGDLFVELDSPWPSPAPDKTWTWPVGSLEYPLPGQFGIGADVEHVLGSGDVPDIEFGEVDFDSEKFMTDLMNDNVERGSGAPDEKQGEFEDEGEPESQPKVEEKQSEGSGTVKKPPTKRETGGKKQGDEPATGKQRGRGEEVPERGVERRWQEGMQALMALSRESKRDPQTRAELKAELARIDERYRFSTLRITSFGREWTVTASMNPKDEKFSGDAAEDEAAEGDRETDETATEGQLTKRDVDAMVRADLPRTGRLPDWAQRGAIVTGAAAAAVAVVLGVAPPGGGQFQSEALRREEARYQAYTLSLPDKSAAAGAPPDPTTTPDLVRFEELVAKRRQELLAEFAVEREDIDDRIRATQETIGRLESRQAETREFLGRVDQQYRARLETITEARERRLRKLERRSDDPLDAKTRDKVNAGYDAELDDVKARMDEVSSETAATILELQERIVDLQKRIDRLGTKRREVDGREAAAMEEFATTVARRRQQLEARGGRYAGGSAVSSGTGGGGSGGSGGAAGGAGRASVARGRGLGPRHEDEREGDRRRDERDTGEERDTSGESSGGESGTTGETGGGFGSGTGPTTAEEAFGSLGEELGLEKETAEPTGTKAERTREMVRRAREAGWVDEEGQPIRDEEGRTRGPGAATQPHRRAGDVREELGVSGTGERAMESAHIVPQVFIKQLPGYTTGEAKTVLLPKGVHGSLDGTWKAWAKRERRAGETTTTIREAYRVLVSAIHGTSELSPDRQGALQGILDQELFSEHGFDPDREIALPYPNLTPGEAGSKSPENAERFEAVKEHLLGKQADAVSESTLDRLGYYRRSGTTAIQIVRKRADDAVYPKLTVDEETGAITLGEH